MKIISKMLAPIILICLFLISVGTVLASDFQVKELKTPNGIKLWFMEEKSLPIISVSLIFRGGSSLDPDEKEGLGIMVSSLIDEGAGELNSYEFNSPAPSSIKLDTIIPKPSFSSGSKDEPPRKIKLTEIMGNDFSSINHSLIPFGVFNSLTWKSDAKTVPTDIKKRQIRIIGASILLIIFIKSYLFRELTFR
jgi:hypothetical protein